MIKHDLYDNTKENNLIVEAKKQQTVFFPKEESQMFPSKNPNYVADSPDVMTDNQDTEAFTHRGTGSYIPLNSSHTATDYIGSTTISVPTTIKEDFATYRVYNAAKDTTADLYPTTDTATKIKTIANGVQGIRIPANVFNTILDVTDVEAIAANNNSAIVNNYGFYYLMVKPKYIETTISNIQLKSHLSWADVPSNNSSGVPIDKRRDIYECDKTDFQGTDWNFETYPNQSGRLYGSVVEIWDAGATELKQVKIMTENVFNFSNGSAMQFVLYPNNFGYDSPDQTIDVGDIIRVFPRETYFDDLIIEINYKDPYLKLENMISFMINDVARDILTGSYQVYDDKGLNVDEAGIVTGNVIHRYQISKTDRYELRKRIKS